MPPPAARRKPKAAPKRPAKPAKAAKKAVRSAKVSKPVRKATKPKAAKRPAVKPAKASKLAKLIKATPRRIAMPAATRPPARKASEASQVGVKGRVARTLPGAPKGKVSAAPVADGAGPVRAYIASLPPDKRAIVQRFDDVAAATLPGIERCIKWGMPFYGVGSGWFVSCGAFADHVKVSFLNGAALEPMPPVGTAKYVRGIEVVRVEDLDEVQVADWLRQASTRPGLGGKK